MDHVLAQITSIAKKYKVDKVVLFGSRARGDHNEVSDYDIAVFGEGILSPSDEARLFDEIDEIETLKKIDVVWVRAGDTGELTRRIQKEGRVLYEQAHG